jgi:hypothetical protein
MLLLNDGPRSKTLSLEQKGKLLDVILEYTKRLKKKLKTPFHNNHLTEDQAVNIAFEIIKDSLTRAYQQQRRKIEKRKSIRDYGILENETYINRY